jgi:hypothetical protein
MVHSTGKPRKTSQGVPRWFLAVCAVCCVSSALACSPESSSPPASPRSLSQGQAPTPRHEICRTRSDIEAALDGVCSVVGIYEMKTFAGRGGTSLGEWPVLVLADGTEVMVESLWDESKTPGRDVVARLRGRQVEVTGPVHSSPPRELPENFAFFCISPVESLRESTR